MLTLELPFPPSLNHYYRRVGHHTLISRRGREYRDQVIAIIRQLHLKPLSGPLDLELELFPPDRRRRDADNFQKCLVDALQHAGVFEDDSQFVHLDIWKCQPLRGGKAVVRIEQVADVKDRANVSLLGLKKAHSYLTRALEQLERERAASSLSARSD